MRHKVRIEGIVTPDDALKKWIHVPFEVPPGAYRLEVNYHYANQVQGAQEFNPGNNIDIGVFDVRGAEFLGNGFRGWSGGARSSFFMTPDAATPGYLRGPLQPGDWTILLGLSKISDPQVPYRINIEFDLDPENPDAGSGELPDPLPRLRDAVAGASNGGGGRWYKGDLHAHSEHSDGQNTVAEIIDYTKRAGLDYFALTDHNTISHWDDLARINDGSPLLIPGEEITMYDGHANIWGIDAWVDFRVNKPHQVEQLIADARKKGSMFSINHPDSPIPWEHELVRGYQGIEVWNAPWRWYNEPALIRWQYHLNRGQRMVAVGGSDSHCVPPAKMTQPNLPGEPCTWVYVEGPLTQRSLLDAVERGRIFISESPNGPFLELRADADRDGVFETLPGDVIAPGFQKPVKFRVKYRGPDGKHLRFFTRKACVLDLVAEREEYDFEFELPLDGNDYLRCEARGFRGRPERGEVVLALTNPIYAGRW